MLELFSYNKVTDLFIKCLFTEVNKFYLFSKSYQNTKKKTVSFKSSCITELAYVYQATTSLARSGIFLQNKLQVSKLLIIVSLVCLICNIKNVRFFVGVTLFHCSVNTH